MATELDFMFEQGAARDDIVMGGSFTSFCRNYLLSIGVDPDAPAGGVAFLLTEKKLIDEAWRTPCLPTCRDVGYGQDRERNHAADCPQDAVYRKLYLYQAAYREKMK